MGLNVRFHSFDATRTQYEEDVTRSAYNDSWDVEGKAEAKSQA